MSFRIQTVSARRSSILSAARQRGQGMTEYLIVVALIAVAAIGVYSALGGVLRAQTAAVAQEIAGQNGNASSQVARQRAQQAQRASQNARNLSDFTQDNR